MSTRDFVVRVVVTLLAAMVLMGAWHWSSLVRDHERAMVRRHR